MSDITVDKLALFDALSAQSFNINPIYIKITGRINYGFFLTQLVFFSRSYGHRPFYKTDDYMQKAYGFTRHEILNARKLLEELEIISTEKKGDGRLYYTLNRARIIELALLISPKTDTVNNDTVVRKADDPLSGKRITHCPESGQSINERNDLNKNDLKITNKRKGIVDNSECNFVILKKFEELDFEEKILFSELTTLGVGTKKTLSAVSNLPMYQLQDLILSSRNRFVKNIPAYLTGGINKLMRSFIGLTLVGEKNVSA
jgi:hypothetical protein